MKRIFPVITILILLSLLGLIFFQVLWLKSSLESQEQKFNEQLINATSLISQSLVEEKGNLMPFTRKNNSIIPSEKLQLELFAPTISQKFTRDEIKQIIRKVFEKHNLKNVSFEFSISSSSLVSEELASENFYKMQTDTLNNIQYVIPLESPSGSNSEGISQEELLTILIPHAKSFI